MSKNKNESNELISIVVACYNQGEYLAETIESITAQTYKNFEIIIINDGSTDNSKQIADEIIRNNQNIKITYLEQENQGVAVARNKAIEISGGTYVLPLDADDKIHPEFLDETSQCLFKNPNISIAYTDYQYFGDSNLTVQTEDYDLQSFLYKKNIFTSTALFKKKAWKDAGGYNKNMIWGFEDWDFWISCGKKGHIGKRVPRVLFYYRAKLNQTTRNKSANLNSPKLFARMTLNHLQYFDSKRIEWAKIIWSDALIGVLNDQDIRGIKYIKSLNLIDLISECELLSERKQYTAEAKLYEFWIGNVDSQIKFAALYNLGVCYEKQNLTNESIKMYEKCLELNPNLVQAQIRLRQLKHF